LFVEKVLVITGGAGSFGNALTRRFLESDIAEIRIFSRDEKKQDDMRKRYQSSKLKFYLGDVRDENSMMPAFKRVDCCLHGAALKQVPSCEIHLMEVVRTNVIGTDNVLRIALHYELRRIVCLSTDRAVYPINAMGISRAMMEMGMVAESRECGRDTVVCGTRYGNVMASRGSVIPLFVDQIQKGQPITCTDPDMTRFMKTLDDAVELVMDAFKHGSSGERRSCALRRAHRFACNA